MHGDRAHVRAGATGKHGPTERERGEAGRGPQQGGALPGSRLRGLSQQHRGSQCPLAACTVFPHPRGKAGRWALTHTLLSLATHPKAKGQK